MIAGLATFGAYALVLAALQRASAPSVAAVRETSVVITALFAWLILREHVRPERLAGAGLVAGGVALLSLTEQGLRSRGRTCPGACGDSYSRLGRGPPPPGSRPPPSAA